MILAFHSIFSMYGFWMPNDPRGSGSDYVAVWELFRYGPATKITSRRSVAESPHEQYRRLAAKQALRYPPVEITGQQAVAIAHGFGEACREASYRIHACSILPDHVHLVIGWHPSNIRRIVGHMKSRATRRLKPRGIVARGQPPSVGSARLECIPGYHRGSGAGDSLCGGES
jgi:hypothetical protein